MGQLVKPPGAPNPFAAVRYNNSIINITIGSKLVEAMLDSGSSISLIRSDTLPTIKVDQHFPIPRYNFVTASGQPLEVVDCIQLSIRINTSEMSHHFSVVNKLIMLGTDFLQRHNLALDFSTNPVTLSTSSQATRRHANPGNSAAIEPFLQAEQLR